MIDFQNGGLESQVFELISKMCDFLKSDDFPHFVTSQTEDGKWKCELNIPGVKQVAVAYYESEVGSINKCASKMLYILKKYHNKNQYYPEYEDSVFLDNIEEYFGDVEFDKQYTYYPYFCDILVEPRSELGSMLHQYAYEKLMKIEDDGGEVETMSDIVSLAFLIKNKKSNYC